jgi:hypothetical protein
MTRLLGRENLHRRQAWQLMANQRKLDVERVQPVWRELHVAQVVCGGLVEAQSGSWGPKSC